MKIKKYDWTVKNVNGLLVHEYEFNKRYKGVKGVIIQFSGQLLWWLLRDEVQLMFHGEGVSTVEETKKIVADKYWGLGK